MCSLLKSEQEKRSIYICVIHMILDMSVLFETPRIIVCAVYIAETHHIDHETAS